jgi:hypothetical protein
VGYYLFKRCADNRSVEPGDGSASHSVDDAVVLFERGEILAAAHVMWQLSADAQDSGDRTAIEDVEDTIRQMRGHLVGHELADFDGVLRFGS